MLLRWVGVRRPNFFLARTRPALFAAGRVEVEGEDDVEGDDVDDVEDVEDAELVEAVLLDVGMAVAAAVAAAACAARSVVASAWDERAARFCFGVVPPLLRRCSRLE